VLGEINYALGVIYFCIGLCAGGTGRYTALYISQKYNRNSLLIFMLLLLLTLSVSLLVYETIEAEDDWSLHSIC
jgi:uncharacterized membrane protein YfcA